MEFKLVRTDIEEPRKIQLPLGSHLIGRGKFLDCDDQRVSRNHGQLEVADDTISLKSLHQNPCFYIKKNIKQVQILKQSESIDLTNGDEFGLLPDSHWYKVLMCSAPDGMQFPDIANEDNTEELDQVIIETFNNKTIDHGDGEQPQGNESSSLLPDGQSPIDHGEGEQPQGNESPSLLPDGQSPIDHGEGDQPQGNESPSLLPDGQSPIDHGEGEQPQGNESPSLLPDGQSPKDHGEGEQPQGNESPSLLPDGQSPNTGADSPSALPQETTETAVATENPPLATSSQASNQADKPESPPPKRGHSPEDSNEEVKKIKLEPPDVKQEPDAQPGPSGDQGARRANDGNNNGAAAGLPPSPPRPALRRERCMYGANCYRRNPQHKAQFAHPTDQDWGGGEQGMCPYGAGCRRTDPRHWRDHTHPPGIAPQRNRPTRKRSPKRKKESDNDSEEDTQDITLDGNLIVTGKRKRKTIKRESWSGSEEEEDPFGTDESDEWQPDSGSLTETQNTQDN